MERNEAMRELLDDSEFSTWVQLFAVACLAMIGIPLVVVPVWAARRFYVTVRDIGTD